MKSFAKILAVGGVMAGFVAGYCAAGARADADSAMFVQPVSNIVYQFDEKQVMPSADLKTFMYNNRIYVPLRFVSENMDAGVSWNPDLKIVTITPRKAVQTVAVPTQSAVTIQPPCVAPTSSAVVVKPGSDYRVPPVKYTAEDYQLTVTSLMKDENYFYVQVKFENTSDNDKAYRLDALKSVATIDGSSLRASDVPSGLRDTNWYNDVRSDEQVSGTVTFGKLPEKYKEQNIDLKLIVVENGVTPKEKEILFQLSPKELVDKTNRDN